MQFNLRSPMLGSIILALIFLMLIPITEWPDAYTNILRSSDGLKFYPPNATYLLKIMGHLESIRGEENTFFKEAYKFFPQNKLFLANLSRLPLVICMILISHSLAKKKGEYALPLTPPLVFSLCNPSQESVAIFILLCAFLIMVRHKYISTLLCILSVTIDRSMAPNAAFLILINISPYVRLLLSSPKSILLIAFILIFITQRYQAVDIFSIPYFSQFELLGITHWEVKYNADFGKNNLYALAASVMGLYGWMSIRPFPFWIYYPVIAIFFMLGFKKSDWSRRGLFLALLLVSYLTMWLLPPVSQARYYPLLTISAWSIIFSGVEDLKLNPAKFHIFILASTCAGCFFALLKNLYPNFLLLSIQLNT